MRKFNGWRGIIKWWRTNIASRIVLMIHFLALFITTDNINGGESLAWRKSLYCPWNDFYGTYDAGRNREAEKANWRHAKSAKRTKTNFPRFRPSVRSSLFHLPSHAL